MERSQNGSPLGAACSQTQGDVDGGSSAPLWPRKVGDIERGLCEVTRQVWVHSRALWLPMEFIEQEARRDLELHGRIVPMDSDEFGAHSVGFYKRGDQWLERHPPSSQLRDGSPRQQDADMSRHVFPTRSGGSEESAATTLCGVSAANCGFLRAVSGPFAQCDQPPPLQSGDVALWYERSAGGGQRFSTVLVEGRAAGETTPGPADAGALSVSDGASTFAVDARDLRRLEIPAALVPRLLSNAGASPSRAPSPHPQAPTEDPWGWLSPAGLASAVEDSIPVAADAVPHVVGKGGHTARLIEEITGVIVGVGDRGDGEAYVTLFGPERRVDAALAIVKAVAGGAWSLPRRLKERGFPMG